jgi:hypothetical protein
MYANAQNPDFGAARGAEKLEQDDTSSQRSTPRLKLVREAGSK